MLEERFGDVVEDFDCIEDFGMIGLGKRFAYGSPAFGRRFRIKEMLLRPPLV
jgi:hypothetical protein